MNDVLIRQRAVEYWYKKLQDLKVTTNLGRAVKDSLPVCQLMRINLPMDCCEQISSIGKGVALTELVICLSVLKIVLRKYDWHGAPIATNLLTDGSNDVLIYALDINTTNNFKSVVYQTKEELEKASQHQSYDHSQLLKLLNQSNSKTDRLNQIACFHDNLGAALGRDFALTLTLEITTSYQLAIRYDSSKFDDWLIHDFGKSFLKALHFCLNNRDTELQQLKLWDENELAGLIHGNLLETKAEYQNINKLFEESSTKKPQKVALIQEGVSMTYGQLNQKINRFAKHLISKHKIAQGARVAVLLEHGFDAVVAMMGIFRSGAIYVPIDGTYPLERIEYILKDSDASYLIAKHTPSLNWNGTIVTEITEIDGDYEAKGEMLVSNDIAYIIYTSGTSGKPKGVPIYHHSLLNLITGLSEALGYQSDWNYLLNASLAFDASIKQILMPLMRGGTLILLTNYKDINQLIRALTDYQINAIHVAPLVSEALLTGLGEHSMTSLKCISSGADILPVSLAGKLLNRFKDVRLFNTYGPTEITINATISEVTNTNINRTVPIGRPLPGYSAYIMSLNGELLPKGAIGELCISGKGLSPGYWNNKKLTNEVFVANPFEEHSMLYKTGDLARWNKEGEIEFFDRVDRQVKFQGTRVELGEIERAIESYAPVNKAYVRKQVDGKGERLVGYYSSTIPLNVEQLKQHLEKWLPRNVIPSSLIGLLSFPLTTQGKINEASLPKAEENPLKNPTNSMEEKLLNLWKDTLKTKDLGITHDFFQHGGHSLNGIQLVNRINYILGSGFTIGDLYENASVEKFAEFAATSNTSSFEIISSIEEQEYYNLSNTQKRFWILQHYHAGRDLYKMPAVIKINGSLDVPRFEAALKSVIIKHQLLRTVFPEVNKVPKQKILKDCEWLHLKVLEVKDWEHFQLKFEYEFLNQPFDFSSCPPINVSLLKINSTQCICYLMMHHIISDGFSMQLLAKDLLDYYFGQEGDHPQIDDQIQYKDYANWKPNLFDQSLHYWDNVLTRGIPNVQLPLDYDRSKTSIGETTVYNAVLQATAFESITTISKQLNITLNSILLGAFGIIACKWAKATEIMIGTVVSNRTHIQLEGLIGPLINFLPIKVQLSPQADIKNDLLAIDSSFRNALKNQEIPFDMLVNKYAGRRSENRNPIFDIAFNFHSHDSMNAVLNPQGHAEPQFIYHDFGNGVSNMDLRLDVVQQENTLGFSLEYNSTLFNPSTIDTLMNAYHNLMNDLSSVLLQTTSGFQPFEKAIPTELTGDPYKNLKLLISSSFIIEPINHAMLDWGEGAGFKLDIEFKYNQIIDDIFNFSTNHEGKDHHGIFFIRFEDWFREWDTNLSHDLLIKKMDLLFIDLTSVLRKQFPLPENTYIVILPHNKGKFEPTVDHHLRRLTEEWITFCRLEANVRLLDFGEIDALYKISDLFNSTTEKLGHMPFTQDFYNCIGTHIIRNLYVRYNPPFKVIAVDCDNTLWQGICGEIGPTKVVISEGCRSLQEFLIQKSKEGFLIVLCSKNNEEDVWQVFEQNSDMRLQKNHITDFKINWMPKSQNLKALAFELNVALDSFIFLDDNPQECEEIERILPEVLALQIPSEHLEIQSFLDHIWAFDQLKTTKEDSNRTAMYKANKVRKEEELKFDSLEDFINSLELQVRLFDLNEQHLDRAFQLLHRTNQFNLNKIELSENELRGILEDDKILSLGIQVEDKYGDYGFVGLLIARPAQTKLLLDSLILSCRVLGKKVEHKILDYLTKYCNEAGLEFIEANFKRTEKNKPIQEFLEKNWGKQATGLYVFQPAMQSTF